jgi:hypothetical protein
VALHLPGTRGGPDAEALRVADQVQVWWQGVRDAVAKELYGHYTAGCDAGVPEVQGLLDADAVWPHVAISSVQVAPYQSKAEIQVALHAAWDEEHTLGALVRDEQLIELNGSILEPL